MDSVSKLNVLTCMSVSCLEWSLLLQAIVLRVSNHACANVTDSQQEELKHEFPKSGLECLVRTKTNLQNWSHGGLF